MQQLLRNSSNAPHIVKGEPPHIASQNNIISYTAKKLKQ